MQPLAGFRSLLTLTTSLLVIGAQHSATASVLSPWSGEESLDSRSVQKRAENTATIPAPIVLAPSQYWDGIDGPWSSFALQVGTPPQSVRVQISTAAPFIWTIEDGGCPAGYVDNCIASRGALFQSNKSLTWVPNSIYTFAFEDNLGMDTNGNTGFDTVEMGWPGAGGPTIDHAIVFNIKSSTYWTGGLGLNPRPSNFTNFNDPQPSPLQQLKNASAIPSLSYGYTAGNQYQLANVYGSLVLGGYDQNRFTPTDVSFSFGEDISRDLLVNIRAITSGSTNLLPDGNVQAFVDSSIATMWLPVTACQAFETAFGLEWNEDLNMYPVNDTHHDLLKSSNASVTFTLSPNVTGGETINVVLPYGAFDLTLNYPFITNPNSSYYFPLQRGNDSQYTLGRAFLQEAYLIADYDRQNFTIAPCSWNQTALANQDIKSILTPGTKLPGSGGSKFPVGAIVGVVIGVIALITIVVGLVWFFRRRKNADKRRAAELEAKEAEGAAKTSSDNETKPFISNPIGGELGGGEIHELTAPHKPFAQEMESPHKIDPNKAGYSEMEGGEYFGPGKNYAHEVDGSGPAIYEMAGSDVHEMPAHEQAHDRK
ncbi:hypothetical protein LTR53_008369 [Teratosphaeriaceae sp. CCFEE 6253]|nr:hypothetical protein LTR53_008369 [Teratosphaeriaceae sp. CCFEE 6253]